MKINELLEDISIAAIVLTRIPINNFFSVDNEVTQIFGSFEFNNDGSMMFATDAAFNGSSTEKVYQYSLSTPFDLSSTVTLVRSKALQSARDFDLGNLVPDNEPLGIEFNHDGTRLFLVGKFRNDISQYTLSEGFNIDTATLEGQDLVVNHHLKFPYRY